MDDFSFWDVFISIFWFMLLFAWIMILFRILADIFRDHSLSGWAKALWVIHIILFPWLGVLIYLIVRGRSMNERAIQDAHEETTESGRRAARGTCPVCGANMFTFLKDEAEA